MALPVIRRVRFLRDALVPREVAGNCHRLPDLLCDVSGASSFYGEILAAPQQGLRRSALRLAVATLEGFPEDGFAVTMQGALRNLSRWSALVSSPEGVNYLPSALFGHLLQVMGNQTATRFAVLTAR